MLSRYMRVPAAECTAVASSAARGTYCACSCYNRHVVSVVRARQPSTAMGFCYHAGAPGTSASTGNQHRSFISVSV